MNENPALTDLLRTAAAPARPEELRGEAAALAAFRSVHRPVAESRSSSFMNRMTRLLTVKAAAVAITATGMGGVALAANAGTLPVPADTPIVGSEAKAAKKEKKKKKKKEKKEKSAGILGIPLSEVPPVLPQPVVPVPAPAPAPAEVEESHGKSATSGKEHAPGQNKAGGEPATGKGKAVAPGQAKKAAHSNEGKSEVSGKEHAPGQNKNSGEPATGKGKGKSADHRQDPKQETSIPTAI